MKYYRVLISLLTIVFLYYFSGNNITFAANLTWQTSKATAVSMAVAEGKKILLVGGRETCGNCQYMKYTACESVSPPIKNLIEQSFIPWFCDVDNSTEWNQYASGLGSFSLPLICVIDPTKENTYQDQTTGIQELQAFYDRLLQYVNDEGDAKYNEGYEAGKKYCIDNPSACGINCEEPICSQVITYAKSPSVDCWIMFPTPCGIPSGWETSNETQSNLCGTANYEAGKQACIDNPASCGIDINGSATPATISADLDLHIPQLNYVSPSGTMNLWVNFEYVGESKGDLLWKLSDFGQK
ncbi:MAG: thioredoxin family protein [Desulfamplus sp.]|nr:thioredoxin family protein [Desulfamplus sp.]